MSVAVRVLRLPHGQGMKIPIYETEYAAGLDLMAAIPGHAPVSLAPSDRVLIPTGLAFALPEGYEAQVRPRSGLALKHGITVLNSPGTIDADYRGEIKVILINLGSEDFLIQRGDRIAQVIISAVTMWKSYPWIRSMTPAGARAVSAPPAKGLIAQLATTAVQMMLQRISSGRRILARGTGLF